MKKNSRRSGASVLILSLLAVSARAADAPIVEVDLGEVMLGIQQHHAKLFYAGQAGNRELAEYELGEVRESFETAAKLHPVFKTLKASLADLIPAMTADALSKLDAAIKGGGKAEFKHSFQALSDACNRCHVAAEHGFIVIQSPTASAAAAFPNQRFEPPKSR